MNIYNKSIDTQIYLIVIIKAIIKIIATIVLIIMTKIM